MKRLLNFWKRDIINKLIVVVSILLAGGIFAFIFLLTNLPDGKSLSDAVSLILPKTPTPVSELSATTLLPTTTPLVFQSTPTFIPANSPSPQPVLVLETATPSVDSTALTPVTEVFVVTPTVEVTIAVPINKDCIPDNPAQTGRVVEVIDGNTIKVLMDGLIYVIRYIGVAAPLDQYAGKTATQINSVFVYGKDVILIADVSDKDDRGRLLRYVLAGDTFVNLELIRQGLVTTLDVPPDTACSQTFKQAELLLTPVP